MSVTVDFGEMTAVLDGETWSSTDTVIADELNTAVLEQRDHWITGHYHPDPEQYIAEQTISVFGGGEIVSISPRPESPEGVVH